MIGVIVVSHGNLAKELVRSAEMLMGESQQMGYEGIMPDESADLFYERVLALTEKVDTGSGIIAMVDLYGGTPCNTVYRISCQHKIRIVTGVNLPMVMAAIAERTEEMTLNEFVAEVLATGAGGVVEFLV